MPDDAAQLDDFGKRLHRLFNDLADQDAITDTLDYILGALHGLARAVELGFVDRPSGYISEYGAFLAQYAVDIKSARPTRGLWLAGFYFNSALQRIAASYDRLPKLLGIPDRGNAHQRMAAVGPAATNEWRDVYLEMNAFKHDPEGTAKGRKVTKATAFAAVEQLLALLEEKRPELLARYGQPRRR